VTDIEEPKPVSSYLKDLIGKDDPYIFKRSGQDKMKNSQTDNFKSAVPNG
jgi:hypothetical protein